MFSFHNDNQNKQDGKILCVCISGSVPSEYHHKINIKHCDFVSDIVWDEESLCATVFQLDVKAINFLANSKQWFDIQGIMLVADAGSEDPNLSLVNATRVDPIKYLSLFEESPNRSDESGVDDGNNQFSEE